MHTCTCLPTCLPTHAYTLMHCTQANAAYSESLQTTRRNLMLLRLSQKGLQSDIRDKKVAADIDSSVVRLRRQRANHRWVLDGNVTSRPPRLLHRHVNVVIPPSTGGSNTKVSNNSGDKSNSTARGTSRPSSTQ